MILRFEPYRLLKRKAHVQIRVSERSSWPRSNRTNYQLDGFATGRICNLTHSQLDLSVRQQEENVKHSVISYNIENKS